MYRLYTVHDIDRLFIEQIHAIECRVFPKALQGTLEEMFPRFYANRDISLLLYDGHRLIGNFSFFPVKKRVYDRIRRGEVFFDSFNITGDDLVPYKRKGNYYLYCLSLAIDAPYQGKGLSRYFVEGFHRFVREKKEQGFVIRSALAAAVSEGGEEVLRRMGFRVIHQIEPGEKLLEYIAP